MWQFNIYIYRSLTDDTMIVIVDRVYAFDKCVHLGSNRHTGVIVGVLLVDNWIVAFIVTTSMIYLGDIQKLLVDGTAVSLV